MDDGPYPDYIQKQDFDSEVTQSEAHQEIAKVMTAFVSDLFKKTEDLAPYKNQTEKFLSPMLEAMEYEGSYLMKNACYSAAELDPTDDPKCLPGSPWIP